MSKDIYELLLTRGEGVWKKEILIHADMFASAGKLSSYRMESEPKPSPRPRDSILSPLQLKSLCFIINDEIPSGPKPSISLPSQNFHKNKPIFFEGLIKITS